MTQPIDRETIRQFAEESGIRCFDEQIVAKLQNVAKLAVAHSRKDAEPVAWQMRTRLGGREWKPWTECRDRDSSEPLQESTGPLDMEFRALFTHPPEADKLLQQALEALEYRLQQTRPIHQADVVMESIRTYLENKA